MMTKLLIFLLTFVCKLFLRSVALGDSLDRAYVHTDIVVQKNFLDSCIDWGQHIFHYFDILADI